MSTNQTLAGPQTGDLVTYRGTRWIVASRHLVGWDRRPYNVLRSLDGTGMEIHRTDAELEAGE